MYFWVLVELETLRVVDLQPGVLDHLVERRIFVMRDVQARPDVRRVEPDVDDVRVRVRVAQEVRLLLALLRLR